MRELGSDQPTAVELEILRILWELQPCPIRDIHTRLNEAKGTNYSTTVKMLSVMLRISPTRTATSAVWSARTQASNTVLEASGGL